jgi:hypothetical protein
VGEQRWSGRDALTERIPYDTRNRHPESAGARLQFRFVRSPPFFSPPPLPSRTAVRSGFSSVCMWSARGRESRTFVRVIGASAAFPGRAPGVLDRRLRKRLPGHRRVRSSLPLAVIVLYAHDAPGCFRCRPRAASVQPLASLLGWTR